MNVRSALLGLFVVLTIVLAFAAAYEAGSKPPVTSTSVSYSTLTQTSTITVVSNGTQTITEDVTVMVQEHPTLIGCGAIVMFDFATSNTTSYVLPANGSQGVLTVETTTTTVTLPAAATVTSTTAISSGQTCV